MIAVQDAIDRITSSCPLQLAVLFGSQAKGTARATSDFDVALMPADPLAELPFELRFAFDGVDVVWLPEASWLLWREAGRDGKPLLEAYEGAFRNFQAQAKGLEPSGFRERERRFLERFRQGDWQVNRDLVRRKLVLLARWLHELDEILAVPLEQFQSTPIIHHAGERLVELIVETSFAVNSEVGSAAGIPPSDYYSSFFSLSRTGWVDSELCTRLAESARLRNAIVHRYEDLSLARIHASMHELAPLWKQYVEALEKHV